MTPLLTEAASGDNVVCLIRLGDNTGGVDDDSELAVRIETADGYRRSNLNAGTGWNGRGRDVDPAVVAEIDRGGRRSGRTIALVTNHHDQLAVFSAAKRSIGAWTGKQVWQLLFITTVTATPTAVTATSTAFALAAAPATAAAAALAIFFLAEVLAPDEVPLSVGYCDLPAIGS